MLHFGSFDIRTDLFVLSIFLIVSSMLFFLRMVLCNRLIHINWVKRKLFIWSMFVPDVSILYFLS